MEKAGGAESRHDPLGKRLPTIACARGECLGAEIRAWKDRSEAPRRGERRGEVRDAAK